MIDVPLPIVINVIALVIGGWLHATDRITSDYIAVANTTAAGISILIDLDRVAIALDVVAGDSKSNCAICAFARFRYRVPWVY
jgi:hypothetical protein